MGLILRTTRDPATKWRAAETVSPGERTEHLLRPISADIVVPLFAYYAKETTTMAWQWLALAVSTFPITGVAR